jgi:hypothetical protein
MQVQGPEISGPSFLYINKTLHECDPCCEPDVFYPYNLDL